MSCHYEVVLWNPGRSGKAVHRKAPSLATAKMLGRALTQHMYGTSKISKFCEGQGKTESFPCSYWGRCSPNPSAAFGELGESTKWWALGYVAAAATAWALWPKENGPYKVIKRSADGKIQATATTVATRKLAEDAAAALVLGVPSNVVVDIRDASGKIISSAPGTGYTAG